MAHLDGSIRASLSPNAQQLFDDIVCQKVLGASSHIRMIAQMMRDLCSTAQAQKESPASLNAKIHQLADFFKETRGEASQAITNALVMMIHGSDDEADCDLDSLVALILHNIEDFEILNKRNLELINQYALSVLSRMNSILLFDYSSTVGKMIETCDHPLEILIAESRAFDGGKPYLSPALKGHHRVHFIPDVAMYHYLKGCDGVFIGSETYYADGRVFNTVGTEMVALLCNALDVPFYVLTTLIKIDIRSIYGYVKPPLMLNLRDRISPHFDPPIKAEIDYSCPELVEIPSKFVTAFITEEGIVPPSAMFHLSTHYLKKVGVIS
jgi:ribose 1,5-bisphosphate isomerase